MPSSSAYPSANQLIAALPADERNRLLACAEAAGLMVGEVLAEPGDLIRDVYFPTDSIVSLVVPIEGGAQLEVGIIGSEGMLGATLVLEVEATPFHVLVQGAGPALRVPAPVFLREIGQCPGLLRAIKRYLYVSMRQLAINSACTHFHLLEARLARWLLLMQDRAHSVNFHITHVFLAYMLGVRRVGITNAANALQQRNLIRYHRGAITILDRARLEAASCGCYRAGENAYRSVLGQPGVPAA